MNTFSNGTPVWSDKDEIDQLRQQLAAALLWKEAVEHELIVAGIWNKSHENDPKRAVKDAIDWYVQVARDHRVMQLLDALKQARHMIYYYEPQFGWNITRIDEVIEATREQS